MHRDVDTCTWYFFLHCPNVRFGLWVCENVYPFIVLQAVALNDTTTLYVKFSVIELAHYLLRSPLLAC